ncbi:VENN motif pre-toxin domain-containing protein, partial [Haemophilus haemolyticus]|uniref:VENN motif pre-toxin domain-containing protein n=1 Tax=Haemophilus haemolyticus TaxID=726 RepID=UPI001864D2D3
SERWQNSHLQADKLITNSEAGNLSLDAANLKAKRWEADIQNLTVTSRQDTEKYESKQTSASASGSVAYGSGGGASVSASYNKAKVDYAQVNEQAGIRVGEDGMEANIHNHTQLNGAIIESDADASKNHFKTKSLTHTDIENKSEIKTESASMGAGTGGINPMQAISSALSLLGNTNESARSTTQSAISGNIQIETETPEKLTALSRDTKNANQRVEKQDLQKVQERQEMAKVIGDISNNAISIATYNEREKINKLGLEKFKLEEQEKALKGQAGNEQQLEAIKQQLTNVQAEITKTQDKIDRTYGIGSEKGMAIRAVTAALQAAAQNDTAGSLVALASPYLNKTIHEMTAGDTAKDKAANLMAHALLSAVEFQVTGKDPLTGAIAGVTGEVTAQILTQAIYNKTPNQLTANEKENISTLSQLAGGLAAALTAKANGTTTEQGGNFLAVTSGAETAKRAVENNYLSIADVQNFIRELSKAQKEGRDTKPILEKYKGISEENRQQLIACKGNVACETAHLHEMNTGAEELERNLGFFSRMTVYYPNDLNTANRIALSNLVESENAESFSKLSDKTKFGLNLMEAGTAMGLGAATGYAKVGFSNVKSLISGKNKAYPTSGMDGYKRTNVGDEDYPSTNNISRSLLRTELAFKDARILDHNGFLTQNAIERSKVLKLKDGYIRNPEIIRVLTKDGSRIEDWEKMTTESIKLPNGQSNQIHFYKNSKTGKIDYETKDFKVKGEVNDFKFKMEENKR